MKTDGNQLAHSFNHTENCEGNLNGLTKREYFAAMAMQGMLSACQGFAMGHEDYLSECALQQADALINALNKEDENS